MLSPITSSRPLLTFRSFGNGCLCCFPSRHASHTRSTHFESKAGCPITTPFDSIARSRSRFMWPIRLCHNSMLVSVSRLLAYISNFTSFASRLNNRLSLRPLAMSQPSFSMKQPSSLKRTCMPCSTIWPTETKFFVIVGTCKNILDASLLAIFPEWDIADVPNRMRSVVSGLYVAGSIRRA